MGAEGPNVGLFPRTRSRHRVQARQHPLWRAARTIHISHATSYSCAVKAMAGFGPTALGELNRVPVRGASELAVTHTVPVDPPFDRLRQLCDNLRHLPPMADLGVRSAFSALAGWGARGSGHNRRRHGIRYFSGRQQAPSLGGCIVSNQSWRACRPARPHAGEQRGRCRICRWPLCC